MSSLRDRLAAAAREQSGEPDDAAADGAGSRRGPRRAAVACPSEPPPPPPPPRRTTSSVPAGQRPGRRRRRPGRAAPSARQHVREPHRGAQGAGAHRAAQRARTAALRRRHGAGGPRVRVRASLQDVLAGGDRVISTRRPRADHPGDQRRHPRLRTHRHLPAGPGGLRGHGQRPGQRLPRAQRSAGRRRREVQLRGAPAPHHRQDRVPHRPPRRRVEPDGGRPAPRRQPCQRRRPAARDRRVLPHHPEVLQGPADLARPHQVRQPEREDRGLPGRLRAGPTQHHRVRQHRCRQDHDAQRALRLDPLGRADRDHRGRRRAPAQAGARRPARVAPGQHRGQGRGHHPRPGQEQPAHASRPHRRR